MKLDKILATLASVLVAAALCIIVSTPPAAAYEISIYGAYPWYFWFLICGSIACGIYILVHHAFMPEQKSKWWVAGLLIVISANLIVILLPVSRGYFISDLSDEVSHYGAIKDILLTGHAGRSDVYPASHILASEASYISELGPRFVMKIMPVVFYLLYMMSLYLLGRAIARTFGQVLLVMAFGSVLLFLYFQYQFLPTQFVLFLIPLILMLFLERNTSRHRLEYTVIFLIMLFLVPFTHPVGSLFLVAIFLIFGISILIHRFLVRRVQTQGKASPYPLSAALLPASIVFVIFFVWFCVFALFRDTVTRAYEWFRHGYGTPVVETLAKKWHMASLTVPEFLELFIKNYGHDLLFILLSLVAIVIILRMVLVSRSSLKIQHIFFALLFIVFGLFYIATLAGAFADVGQNRTLMWAIMGSIILNGMVLYEWMVALKGKRLKIYVHLLTAVIIVSTIIGVFSVYPSPNIRLPNVQVTKMDWGGMEWFLGNKDGAQTFYVVSDFPRRAPGGILGRDATKPATLGEFYPVPPRFGYDSDQTLAYSFDSDAYIVITEYDKAYFVKLWPDVPEMVTADDFNKLKSDPAVDKIYDNGGLEISRVSTAKES